MATTIRIRRGLDANRASLTPLAGEFIYTTDTKRVFMGDGVTVGACDFITPIVMNDPMVLTNKTLDDATNTLSNYTLGIFAPNVIDTDVNLTAQSDVRLATQRAVYQFVNARVTGQFWRPEVQRADEVLTTKPTGDPALVDGVAVTAGDRVLFMALSNGAENDRVWVAQGTGTNITGWTLATDGQAGNGDPTDGDTLYVEGGTTKAGVTFTYNAGMWVQSGSSSGGALIAANNLSDLTNLTLARSNLAGGVGTVVTTVGVETLTNKTINAANNTLTNIDQTMLVNDVGREGELWSWNASGVPSRVTKGVLNQVLAANTTGVPTFKTLSTLGIVVGPATSVDNTLARFDGIDGKTLQGSGIVIADNNDLTSPGLLNGVSPTEMGYVVGVTSPLQTQLNARVSGPASAADNALPRYDGTTGKLLQGSSVLVDDTNNMSGIVTLTTTGTINGASPTEIGYLVGVTSPIQPQLTGRVVGPASATANALARYDGTTGKLLKNSVALLADDGTLDGVIIDGGSI